MAIQIRIFLDATPNPVSLPGTVTLTQTLRSNRESEGVEVEYHLDEDHNVFFEDSAGGPTKTVQRSATVRRSDTPLRHRVKLLLGQQAGAMAAVQIDQKITDGSSIETEDQCIVVL